MSTNVYKTGETEDFSLPVTIETQTIGERYSQIAKQLNKAGVSLPDLKKLKYEDYVKARLQAKRKLG